jgi:hypothetical protein
MLIKTIGLTAVMLAAMSQAAWAVDYSKVSCQNPRFQHFMETRLPRMTALGNSSRHFSARFSSAQIVSAQTISATSGKIICQVEIALTSRGATRDVHGQFTTMATPHGARWRWLPNY